MANINRECRRVMRHARDYNTWFEAAQELDRREGWETWREEEDSSEFDVELIRNRTRLIRRYRRNDDIKRMTYHLRQGLHWNLGNMGSPALYNRARTGTKYLIHDFVNEMSAALNYLADADFDEFPTAEKIKFFQDVALSFGRSALMLSGGVNMGFFHLGVLKALQEQQLLPKVISGSSAGAFCAAFFGTRAEEDVPDFYDIEHYDLTFWKLLSPQVAQRRGVVMDQNQLRRTMEQFFPDVTFEDAYKASGRVINITVSPPRSTQIPRLLNYLTFPHLYVREAVLASCAVPFVFGPVMLMTRDPEGEKEPFMPSQRWSDGSLKSDMPIMRLRRLHNVNHTIVSQTNPHVLPFMQFSNRDQGGMGQAASEFMLSTARVQAGTTLDLLRRVTPHGRVNDYLGTAHAMVSQNYRGSVTILPRFKAINYARIAANPSVREIHDYILEGERSTWAKIAMIRTQTTISRTLDACLKRLQARTDINRPSGQPKLRVVR